MKTTVPRCAVLAFGVHLPILDVHCESQGFMTPNLEHDALPVLVKQARKAGCDGIIEIEARKPANWTFETRALHFSAVGIAYK